MKKIFKKREILDVVGYENIEYFVSSDGKEFSGENAELNCQKYEDFCLDQENWKAVPGFIDEFSGLNVYQWKLAVDEETLELIKQHFGYYNTIDTIIINGILVSEDKKNSQLHVGNWIGLDCHDGGDYTSSYYIFTSEHVKKKVRNLWNKFDEITDNAYRLTLNSGNKIKTT